VRKRTGAHRGRRAARNNGSFGGNEGAYAFGRAVDEEFSSSG